MNTLFESTESIFLLCLYLKTKMISKSLFLNISIISSRVKIAEISKKETFLQSIIIFLLPFSFSYLSSKKDAVPKNKDPFTFII